MGKKENEGEEGGQERGEGEGGSEGRGRRGGGKGSPGPWGGVVQPGRGMFELSGVGQPIAKEAMRLAAHKLPIQCKFVTREGDLFES